MIAKLTNKSPAGRLQVGGLVEVTHKGTFDLKSGHLAHLTDEQFSRLKDEFALEAIPDDHAENLERLVELEAEIASGNLTNEEVEDRNLEIAMLREEMK